MWKFSTEKQRYEMEKEKDGKHDSEWFILLFISELSINELPEPWYLFATPSPSDEGLST